MLEKWAVKRASKINLVSYGFSDYFQQRYPSKPFSYYTNGIDEEFILQEDGEVGATEAYGRFEEWYEKNISKNVPKQKRFGKLMTQRFKKAKVNGTYKYFGLKLL